MHVLQVKEIMLIKYTMAIDYSQHHILFYVFMVYIIDGKTKMYAVSFGS